MNDPFFVFSCGEPTALQLRNKGGSQNCLIFVPLSAINWFKRTIFCMETGLAKNTNQNLKSISNKKEYVNIF